MHINNKEWKKVKVTKEFTLMRNKSGHELKILHKGLSKANKQLLGKIKEESDEEPQTDTGADKEVKGDGSVEAPIELSEGGMVPKSRGGEFRGELKPPPMDPRAVSRLGMQDPEAYIREMEARGKGNLVTPADRIRASGFQKMREVKKFMGFADGGVVGEDGQPIEASVMPTQEDLISQEVMAANPMQAALDQEVASLRQQNQGFLPSDMIPGTDREQYFQDKALDNLIVKKQTEQNLAAQAEQQALLTQQQQMAAAQQRQAKLQTLGLAQPQAEEAQAVTQEAPQEMPQEAVAAPQVAAPNDPFNMMSDAFKASAAADIKQAAESAKAMQETLSQEQQLQADYAAKIEEKTKLMDQALAEADVEVDPNRAFGRMDTGQRLATTIGALMAGFGGGIAGDPMAGVRLLNKIVDDDISAQRENIKNKKAKADSYLTQTNKLQDLLDARRAQLYNVMAHKIKLAEMRAVEPKAKANLQMQLAQVEGMRQQAAAKVALNEVVDKLEANGTPDSIPGAIAAIAKQDPKKAEEMRAKFVPGVGMALTPKDADELKPFVASSREVQKSVKDLLQLSRTPGAKANINAQKQAQGIVTMLVGALNKPITGGGPMSDSEKELISTLATNPLSIFSLSSAQEATLKTLRDKVFDKADANARSRTAGVGFNVANILEPSERQVYEWAKRNPGTQKSIAALRTLGLD